MAIEFTLLYTIMVYGGDSKHINVVMFGQMCVCDVVLCCDVLRKNFKMFVVRCKSVEQNFDNFLKQDS